ncbi:hypothetical protein OUZ56_018134 [Daphnia magna]|uniref:Uncharacterized protein n=1 Tax=Daphnia magna TaxID=35525 RepID=A0ABQ9Z8A3_9CRUS|nr:hypothetical protein OUZ56_018134 [Daphnia magna]
MTTRPTLSSSSDPSAGSLPNFKFICKEIWGALKNPSGGQILSSVDGRSLRFVMKFLHVGWIWLLKRARFALSLLWPVLSLYSTLEMYALKMELCSVADSWLLMSLPMSGLELSSDASLSAFSFPAIPIWLGTQ